MTTGTTTHPLLELHRALREADVVLVPTDATAPDPFNDGRADLLRDLCTSPIARNLVARAAAEA